LIRLLYASVSNEASSLVKKYSFIYIYIYIFFSPSLFLLSLVFPFYEPKYLGRFADLGKGILLRNISSHLRPSSFYNIAVYLHLQQFDRHDEWLMLGHGIACERSLRCRTTCCARIRCVRLCMRLYVHVLIFGHTPYMRAAG
jgi:hypothetical protein